MKKNFKSLLLMAALLVVSFSFVACGDDDDDKNASLNSQWQSSEVAIIFGQSAANVFDAIVLDLTDPSTAFVYGRYKPAKAETPAMNGMKKMIALKEGSWYIVEKMNYTVKKTSETSGVVSLEAGFDQSYVIKGNTMTVTSSKNGATVTYKRVKGINPEGYFPKS